MTEKLTSALAKYIPVNKHCLMKMYGEITFDLYTIPPGKQHFKEPVLLVRKNSMLSDVRDVIAASGFENFFIRKEEQKNLHHLLENFIGMMVEDPLIPLMEKSSIIYNCAANVMKDIFSDPRSGENLKRTEDITGNIIKFALNDQASITSLLQLSSHDYYTFTHCLNVAVFSIGLWQTIYPARQDCLREFALGCILHDIGKSQIDDAILNKPGKLTDDEFTVMKRHPQYGYKLMAQAIPSISLDVILHHHEKHDGKGYPRGLQGDRISDYAKIAAIADVYDALTTKRSYAEARDPFKAVLTMKEEMVGHFEQDKFISFIHLLSGKNSGAATK
ncbi:MAG: HD domain-containing protein [Proteobacteria bacterium]|nr:HD domain-containing protein [Pseudomonadota bacterium]MBU4295481.1 HD domain-containing protein [Pseudomonadota bacterium]MCG2747668.1 HD domain-containing protein [Desulfobulbaceae bacterium]